MIYNDFQGKKLSALGMGNMRLPVVSGDDSRIDVETAKKMIAYCMEHGINYYDTAYGYHGGQSELVVGELLKAYERDTFYLASKFPGYDLSNMTKVKEIFNTETLENVPSWHHQALTGLEGTKLILAGFTDVNGLETVEIIERADKDFVFGFQFHPEAAYVKYLEGAENSFNFLDKDTASIIFKEIGELVSE